MDLYGKCDGQVYYEKIPKDQLTEGLGDDFGVLNTF